MVVYIDHEPCPSCGTEKSLYGMCPVCPVLRPETVRVRALDDRPRPHPPTAMWLLGFGTGLVLGALIAVTILALIGGLA